MKHNLKILLLTLLTFIASKSILDKNWYSNTTITVLDYDCELYEDDTELTEESPAALRSNSLKKTVAFYQKSDLNFPLFYPFQDLFVRLYKRLISSVPKQKPGYGQLFLFVLY